MHRRELLGSLAAWAALPSLPALRQRALDLASELDGLPADELWHRVGAEFVVRPGLTHMNAATIGACPRMVLDTLTRELWETESDPQDHVFGAPAARLEEVRAGAAAFLGADLDEVALTRNTTEGMNAVAQGIDLKPGDQIVTTNHEHPGGRVCWDHLAARYGVEIVEISMPAPVRDEAQILDLVKAHLTPRTRVCSFSHVCTITGLVMPMARISEITRPRDILLVCDGAQAPGMLQVDVHALGVDTYASSSHKWMLAPKGSGLLYVRKGVQDRVRPLLLHSGYAAYTASSGTRNVPGLLAHGAAMAFHEAIGRERVQARCQELQERLRQRLAEDPSLRSLTPTTPGMYAGILTVSLGRGDYREVRARLLQEHGFVVKNVAKPEYNALRLSTHVFNDEGDVDRLAAALRATIAG